KLAYFHGAFCLFNFFKHLCDMSLNILLVQLRPDFLASTVFCSITNC
uniref:Uncharacterized protein n=1 Tax=Triticum urartu TaxID=4572 RepID=A0A8R7Q711_TRIUA